MFVDSCSLKRRIGTPFCYPKSATSQNWPDAYGEYRTLYKLKIRSAVGIYFPMGKNFQTVIEAGGAGSVSAEKRWGNVTKRLGFKQQRANKIKKIYFKWIDTFHRSINVRSWLNLSSKFCIFILKDILHSYS